MEWALAGKALASSEWQVAHWTFKTLVGCGKSLMSVSQSLQPRTACALAACLAGSMEMLLPESDFIPAWPWQARQASSLSLFLSAAGAAQAKVEAKDKTKENKAMRSGSIYKSFLLIQMQISSTDTRTTRHR